MSDVKTILLSSLGQIDNIIIEKTIDELIIIDSSCNIKIKANASVSFIDISNNANINLESNINSFVNYSAIDSYNSKRIFNISGEINYLSISLKETSELLKINLCSENAIGNAKCLVISAATDNKFVQEINHLAINTISNIANVGVAISKSNIMFDTTGKVAQGMKLSKCSQLSRGIVMDDVSSITAKPILLIDEFDCFANHGASIGKMSDEDLFYLMSRGLSKKEAFLLILKGIIQPFISSINIEEYKNRIDEEIQNLIEM